MALISLAEWIDRYGDVPDDPDRVVDECLASRVEVQVEAAPRAVRPRPPDYRIAAARPSGSEIAATRTRLL